MREHVLQAWEELCATEFPSASSSLQLVEIRAELANISTFGAGCVTTFLQRGELRPSHYTILLNCLDALQKLEGKMALLGAKETQGDPDEVLELKAYRESLERILEAILVQCANPDGGNGDLEA